MPNSINTADGDGTIPIAVADLTFDDFVVLNDKSGELEEIFGDVQLVKCPKLGSQKFALKNMGLTNPGMVENEIQVSDGCQ